MSGRRSSVDSSARRAASSARRASKRRDFAVPTGISRIAAISASGRPSRWWRTRIARWSTGERRAGRRRGRPRRRGVTIRCGCGVGQRDDLRRRDLADPPPAAGPERHPRGVDGDPLQPRLEPLGLAEARQLAPRGNERLLGGVAGVGLVAENRAGQSVHGIHPGADDRLERVEVTVPGPVDQRPVDRGSDRRVPPGRSPIRCRSRGRGSRDARPRLRNG